MRLVKERVQEIDLKDILAVAKPKLMHVNIYLKHEGTFLRKSPENQSLDQSGSQTAAGNSLRRREVNSFERRKLEFSNMQISNSRYLEKVYKNTKKKVNLAEKRAASTNPSTLNHQIDLVNVLCRHR